MKEPSDDAIEQALESAESNVEDRRYNRNLPAGQVILTNQLIIDIRENTKSINKLNDTMGSYTFWSRLFTIAVLILTAVLVLQGFNII